MNTIGFLLAAALAIGAPLEQDAHVGYSFRPDAPYGMFSGFEPGDGGIGGFVLVQASRPVSQRPGRVLDVPLAVVQGELGEAGAGASAVQAVYFGALVPLRKWLAVYGGPGLVQRERYRHFLGAAPEDDVYIRDGSSEGMSVAAGVLLRLKPAFVQVGAVIWPATVSVGVGVVL